MFKRNRQVKKTKRGQSTIEYIILVAAVIAALLVFYGTSNDQGFRGSINKTLTYGTNGMEQMGKRLATLPTR